MRTAIKHIAVDYQHAFAECPLVFAVDDRVCAFNRRAAALEFAGNDVKIELGEDGHSNRHGASILPDTLRWLWRDYPQPIGVGEPPTGAARNRA